MLFAFFFNKQIRVCGYCMMICVQSEVPLKDLLSEKLATNSLLLQTDIRYTKKLIVLFYFKRKNIMDFSRFMKKIQLKIKEQIKFKDDSSIQQ